ncbi:MAG: 50S ribosomal protein L22 [Methanobacteriota archaeon]|nr:MAG: 50S ribosomal protein L22 [Euryarchaeota archaeon]
MMIMAYTMLIPKDDNYIVGKARIEEVNASFKDLGAVCDNIRYKKVEQALELLEKAAKGELPIRYRKHNKKLAHRRELQGQKGRYPRKAAAIVLAVLRNAVANATQQGANEFDLVVKHACANKKRTYYRVQPKGRRGRHDYELARVELVVMQRRPEEKKKEAKPKPTKTAKPTKEEAKPTKAEEKKKVEPEETTKAVEQPKKSKEKAVEEKKAERKEAKAKPAKKEATNGQGDS